MSDITNSRGGTIAVSTTNHEERIVPVPVAGTNQEFCNTLRVFNTGSVDIRVGINDRDSDFTVATVSAIPPGENHYFVSERKPIKSFIIATESGTSTATYTAF